jgi:hypothetical protein
VCGRKDSLNEVKANFSARELNIAVVSRLKNVEKILKDVKELTGRNMVLWKL